MLMATPLSKKQLGGVLDYISDGIKFFSNPQDSGLPDDLKEGFILPNETPETIALVAPLATDALEGVKAELTHRGVVTLDDVKEIFRREAETRWARYEREAPKVDQFVAALQTQDNNPF